MRNPQARQSRRHGNAMIGFGLAFPVLFGFLAGMYQIGFSLFVYNELQGAVRAGARYASTADFDSNQGGQTFRNNVRNMVVYGNPAGGATKIVPGLATSQVNVTWQADAAGIPQTVTVNINGFNLFAVFRTFTLTTKPRATFIYLGQFL